MKRLMRNAHLRFRLGKATSDTATRNARQRGRGARASALASSLVVATVAMVVCAAPASAAWGDGFGLIPINGGSASNTLDVPALPGAEHYYYAGTCDRSSSPTAGSDLAPLGGIGTMPSTATAPDLAPDILDVPLLGSVAHCIDWRIGLKVSQIGGPEFTEIIDAGTDPENVFTPAPSWRLPAETQAGGHPDGTAAMAFRNDGDVDNIVVDLPAGFVGNPNAVSKCTAKEFLVQACPPRTQVGILNISLYAAPLGGNNFGPAHGVTAVPVFNLEPRTGNVAELGLSPLSKDAGITARLVAKARTNGDFGVTTFIGQLPAAALPLSQQTITLWGVPWAAGNDVWRAPLSLGHDDAGCNKQPETATTHVIPPGGLSLACRQSYHPSWGPIQPFISNPTECTGTGLTTWLTTDVYQRPGAFTASGDPDLSDPDWKRYSSPAPAVTGCDKPAFAPSADFSPTSTDVDSATGLAADITIPQNNAPPALVASDPNDATGAPAHWRSDAGVASSHLDRTVVSLPRGMSVNPSAAAGLAGCTDAQMGVTAVGNPFQFDNVEPSCPDGSKIGTAEATTPLLEGSPNLTGEVVLGAPKSTDPSSGQMFRLFLILRNKDRGLLAKIHGTSVADPATGRLTATFDKNPRVPVENIEIALTGGSRGLLAMPQTCNTRPDQYQTASSFTPWSRSHLPAGDGPGTRDPVDITQNWVVDGNCTYGFNPGLTAGMSNRAAREDGTFGFEFTRPQGDQWVKGLTAELPQGLLASVKGVPLCTNTQANAANCPAESRIGLVDASAGSGDPFVLEQKGEVFLTEGYKGGAYGLMVKVRVIAGPFRGAMELSPIVVRQAIHVDRKTAQVTVVSDPFPTIHHGVPLRMRRVLVNVDRPNFMLNPSDCDPKQVQSVLSSAEGATAAKSSGFQASGCSSLAFKPKLALRLTGKKQVKTGKHPGIRATVTQQSIGEAGIEKAVVRLPKSLALDPDNAQALCEFVDGTKPDIENHCPKASIVGRARAISPLLNDPLAGDVYFVKNVRIDPDTGNQIRTLPMIIVALRGEIAVNLRGEASTTRGGKLVNTFASVPDAPISRFNLNIKGGKTGIIAVTRTRRSPINLCATGRQIAEVDLDGHNNRRHDRDIAMAKPCTKRQTKAAKRQAKRAAAKAKRASKGRAR
jgi:hypothetical protein